MLVQGQLNLTSVLAHTLRLKACRILAAMQPCQKQHQTLQTASAYKENLLSYAKPQDASCFDKRQIRRASYSYAQFVARVVRAAVINTFYQIY